MPTSPDSDFFSTQVRRGDYLITDREGVSTSGLEVVCAGWERCDSDYEIRRESFPYFALEFVASGDWTVEIAGEKRVLGVGSAFSYGPGVRYRMKASGVGGWSKYFVDFRGSQASERLGAAGLEAGSVADLARHRWVRELFDQIIETKDFASEDRNAIADQTLELLLARLPLHFSEGRPLARSWETFERCRSYLVEHHLTIESLSDAARACGVSPAYLSRLFKKHSNETPKAFVDRLKMGYAAQMLLRGKLQVKQVAMETGFVDVFHFSRVFKKTFGAPPSEFARRFAE